MFCDTVWVKLPSTPLSALDQLRRIVLLYLDSILTVYLFDAFLLGLGLGFIGLRLGLGLPILFLFDFRWIFLIGVFFLVVILLIIGDVAFLFECVLFWLLVDVFVGIGLLSIFIVILGVGRVVVGVLIVIWVLI